MILNLIKLKGDMATQKQDMAGYSSSGGVTASQMNPMYYLRDKTERKNLLSTNSGSGGASVAQKAVVLTMQEQKLLQLKADHPDYSAFMIDMAMYQDEQETKERHRKEREVMQTKKERRLAARFKAIDELVSLPTVLDSNGNPAALDKKALAWMKHYHPQLAEQWSKLISLSLSVMGPATQQKIEDPDVLDARELQKIEEMDKDMQAHLKRGHEALRYKEGVTKFHLSKYEERSAKAGEARLAVAEEFQKALSARVKHVEKASLAKEAALSARVETVRQKLEERFAEQQQRLKAIEKARARQRSNSPDRTEVLSARRQQLVSEKARENDEKMRKSEEVLAEEKKRVDDRRKQVIQAHAKANETLATLEKDKREENRYIRQKHYAHHQKVLESNIQGLEQAVSTNDKKLTRLMKEIDTHEDRREAFLASVAARPLEMEQAVLSRSAEQEGSGQHISVPRYAQEIRHVSPRIDLTRMASTATVFPATDGAAEDKRDLAYLNRLKEVADYTEGTRDLAAKDKALLDAEKRKKTYLEELQEYHGKRLTEKIEKCQAQKEVVLTAHMSNLEKKLQREAAKHREFVPVPPLLFKGAKQPVERVVSPRRFQLSPKSPAPPQSPGRLRPVDARLQEASQRVEALEEQNTAALREAHEQQLAKEEAIRKAQRTYVKDVRERAAFLHERKAEAHEAKMEQLYRDASLDSSRKKVLLASERAEHLKETQAAELNAKLEAKMVSAQRSRMEREKKADERILSEVRKRDDHHRNMFQLKTV